MATRIMLKHPQTGVIKPGYFGFSWTTFFFGGFPALFRGQIGLGLIVAMTRRELALDTDELRSMHG